MKNKNNKTTKKHFKIFVKECQKWIDAFGFYEWEWTFYHEEKMPDTLASCSFDTSARYSNIYLSTNWGNIKPTVYELKKSAFHEIIESGLLGKITVLAKDREFDHTEWKDEVHKVVHRLERTIFDKR